jgi:hypothetical protein
VAHAARNPAQCLPPLVAEFGLRFCFVFLFIASLSFLGLGIQPPTADWGGMVRENAGAITFGIMTPLFPAGGHCLFDRGCQPDRGLVPAHCQRAERLIYTFVRCNLRFARLSALISDEALITVKRNDEAK